MDVTELGTKLTSMIISFTKSISTIHFSEVTSSQPVHSHDAGGSCVDGVEGDKNVIIESFTQPSRFDELIIGTQIPCTPGASQVHI